MSFRTQDDSALLIAFLTWYDTHGDGSADAVMVARFIAERDRGRNTNETPT